MDVRRLIVQAGDLFEGFTARAHEGRTALTTNFLERFQAVGDECRAKNEKTFYPGLGQAHQFMIGEGREPRLACEAGLKGDGVLLWRQTGALYERACRGEDLGAVTSCLQRRTGVAAIGHREAVRLGRIGFS